MFLVFSGVCRRVNDVNAWMLRGRAKPQKLHTLDTVEITCLNSLASIP